MLALKSLQLLFVLYGSAVSASRSREAADRLRGTKHNIVEDTEPLQHAKRSASFFTPTFANPKAATFAVNSSALPLVTFPLQNSWAGRLPISATSGETRQLFFWYWPSSQPTASKTLTIWLNGGPGCSSLAGFLQENGPVSFQPGAKAPVSNPNAWTTASDVLWIEQPVGTGFTLGTPNIQNESQLATQFYGFLQQFFGVFTELTSKQLFITGESYAGFYIPYIASRIINASAAEKAALPLSLQGLLINDGVYSSDIVGEQAPTAGFAKSFQSTLGLSTSTVNSLASKSSSCGYDAMISQITYPPKGKINLPNGNKDTISRSCDVFDTYLDDAEDANACFNIYRITDKCPTPNDPIESYFSRSDVQKLLHVSGFGTWSECSNRNVFVNGLDNSAYSETLFPNLLANLPRGMTLWHGLIDSILFNIGDRLTIQNLTWGGLQGFQTAPSTPLIVGGTQAGIFHTERNLTYIEVNNAGHMIPEDQSAVALHVFQAILGQTTL
ncbi:alpha/beta-hydrolase [Sistotremastrum suecicum HHB10207 ss-3]|uniref:Carboxypeptidase n=1 Tax=Sistotremastrum suecicum HHB10207 ss-3 TaxID=1314776 RepID=A0A166CFR3_9AGAM|nr:alpha/beta-hydrolase [Sistotremastrum suecicum HHB10207 ss-3]